MNHGARLAGYLLVLSALAALLVAIPSAWATPEQSQSTQMTVPTRTPKPGTPPPLQSTAVPQPTVPPAGIPAFSTETPRPARTVTAPVTTLATPVTAAELVLNQEVTPATVWPGATLHYTLTLSNRGTASAEQVVIQDTLPADLIPGTIVPGPNARWEGRTLQAQAPVLPAGAQLVIAFTAQVRRDARAGGVIANQASAAAAGNLQAVAGSHATLPPAELPPTGGFLDGIPSMTAWGL